MACNDEQIEHCLSGLQDIIYFSSQAESEFKQLPGVAHADNASLGMNQADSSLTASPQHCEVTCQAEAADFEVPIIYLHVCIILFMASHVPAMPRSDVSSIEDCQSSYIFWPDGPSTPLQLALISNAITTSN